MSESTRNAGRADHGTTAAVPMPPLPQLRPLDVSVRHGSLEHAPYRLLVGHYQGLPFSGAEAQLNRRSEGRLERLLLTHQYPQRLGEIAILEPVDEAPPQGAIILGLGPTGELAPLQLRDIVTRALLRVALNELDRRLVKPAPSGGWPPLGVSSVLVGSAPGSGLPVEASVRALIDGTVAANGRLTRLRVDGGGTLATDVVAIEALELIERYEDRVDLIVGVLARISSMEGGSGPPAAESVRQPVNYRLQPAQGEGRSSARSPIDAADEVWRRIDIRASQTGAPAGTVELEFTSIGRLARAERLVGLAEQAILEPLLNGAIENEADPDISGTLYELLLPQELKGELGAGEHLHLLVDQHTADYPWELMRPRPDEEEQDRPLALRVGVLRQFRETESVRFDVRRSTGHKALVIGNPPSPPNAQLPGAMKESLAAARRLRDAGWNVSSLIWDTAGNPITSEPSSAPPAADDGGRAASAQAAPIRALHLLLNGDWRVVHIAAHGQLTGDASSTGVVLGDLRLTANVFSKMSVVPDLVVLNSCHLGRVLTGANRVAASVGRALLKLGVRAVVVAGWAVNDAAAEAFSKALYDSLLRGVDFGRAVSDARAAAWKLRPKSLTWGAYQCYGDPGFSLTTRAGPRERPSVYTVGELRRRIQWLQAKASDQGRSTALDPERSGGALKQQLCELGKEARRLGSPPAALADLADAWSELLEVRSAIARYRTAVARGGSNVTIRSIEQLGNLLSRRSQQLHRRGLERASRGDAERAQDWLTRALALGPTGERLALMGGHHKRQATMTTGSEREDHLRHAVRYFVAAQRVQPKQYHELNAIQLAVIARLHGVDVAGPESSSAIESRQPLDTDARVRAETAPDFWTRAGLGDRLLTDMIVVAAESDRAGAEELDTSAATLVDAYRAAFRLRSSARERDSVIGHLRDLDELVPEATRLATALQKVRADLESWSGQDSADDAPSGT